MERALEKRGLRRSPDQTPLEFAFATQLPEAIGIVQKYNEVRYGGKHMTVTETDVVEGWLRVLELKTETDRESAITSKT